MSYTQKKINLLLQYNKLIKIVLFMVVVIYSVFLTVVDAKTGKNGNNNSYFLDTDGLEEYIDSEGSVSYMEKNNSTEWIFIPIKSAMKDFRKTVANVVATELHRRINKHSLVPHTKFLIEKEKHNYKLLGSVYKKFSSTTPILEITDKRDLDNYADTIYKDHNVEKTIAMWSCLGLPIAPSTADLEFSEDNNLVRYDYYKSFQYDSEIHKYCFCTYDFKVSDYNCNLGIINGLVQALRSKRNKETL